MKQLQNKHTYLSLNLERKTMKPTLLTLSFLLFSFTYFPLAFTELVKDTDGNALFPGGKYYILPATDKFGAGGGVRLGETSDCPVPMW